MRTELAVMVGFTAFAVASMLIYVIRDRRRLVSDDSTGRGGSFFLGFWVRNWFYWLIEPVKKVSFALRLSPLFYNLLAVGFGLASMYAFWTGHLPLGGAMILLSGFADVMDGEIARGLGIASKEGAFLDSTLDRFSEFAGFVGLVAFYNNTTASLLIVVALGGSLLVSYTRARGESLGVLCKLGFMQRAERMILLGAGAIFDPSLSALFGRAPGFILAIIIAVIAVGTVSTSIFRTWWIARRLREEA